MKTVKILLSLCLTMVLAAAAMPALADDTDYQYFAPYSAIDVNIFKEAGFTCGFDNMQFAAELDAPETISYSDSGTSYTISFDLRMLWNSYNASATWIPRIYLYTNGSSPRWDNTLNTVYIKAGENRYQLTVSDVYRYESSSSWTASESVTERIGQNGLAMLEYIAATTHPVEVRFNTRAAFTLTDEHIAAIRSFLDTCRKAGVFAQPEVYLYDDSLRFRTITLFNQD